MLNIKNKSNGLPDKISQEDWDNLRPEFKLKYEVTKKDPVVEKPSEQVSEEVKSEVEEAQENVPKKPKPRKKKKDDKSED